ncbi:MAG: hypothetical protein JSV40_04975 [Deltaproteobacteria bacterium]|nr:MAG: hypothetical protein JSV40_04975 [Deltaproteobacteria bacterium]
MFNGILAEKTNHMNYIKRSSPWQCRILYVVLGAAAQEYPVVCRSEGELHRAFIKGCLGSGEEFLL